MATIDFDVTKYSEAELLELNRRIAKESASYGKQRRTASLPNSASAIASPSQAEDGEIVGTVIRLSKNRDRAC